jgi:hypothetical protein
MPALAAGVSTAGTMTAAFVAGTTDVGWDTTGVMVGTTARAATDGIDDAAGIKLNFGPIVGTAGPTAMAGAANPISTMATQLQLRASACMGFPLSNPGNGGLSCKIHARAAAFADPSSGRAAPGDRRRGGVTKVVDGDVAGFNLGLPVAGKRGNVVSFLWPVRREAVVGRQRSSDGQWDKNNRRVEYCRQKAALRLIGGQVACDNAGLGMENHHPAFSAERWPFVEIGRDDRLSSCR